MLSALADCLLRRFQPACAAAATMTRARAHGLTMTPCGDGAAQSGLPAKIVGNLLDVENLRDGSGTFAADRATLPWPYFSVEPDASIFDAYTVLRSG
ncbi:hypothetical protein GCM10009560_73620 [Nonomuraea longicatena]|uniref:Uncharacterized protein n=1 Tax=Nonomuraea longicatena TaxID=83682 RepID=A0ABN1R5H9_9ACTN